MKFNSPLFGDHTICRSSSPLPNGILTVNEFCIFSESLASFRVNNSHHRAMLRLLGDNIADRISNDILTFALIHKIVSVGYPVSIIYSNHDNEFIRYLCLTRFIQDHFSLGIYSMGDLKHMESHLKFLIFIDSLNRLPVEDVALRDAIYSEVLTSIRTYLSVMKLFECSPAIVCEIRKGIPISSFRLYTHATFDKPIFDEFVRIFLGEANIEINDEVGLIAIIDRCNLELHRLLEAEFEDWSMKVRRTPLTPSSLRRVSSSSVFSSLGYSSLQDFCCPPLERDLRVSPKLRDKGAASGLSKLGRGYCEDLSALARDSCVDLDALAGDSCADLSALSGRSCSDLASLGESQHVDAAILAPSVRISRQPNLRIPSTRLISLFSPGNIGYSMIWRRRGEDEIPVMPTEIAHFPIHNFRNVHGHCSRLTRVTDISLDCEVGKAVESFFDQASNALINATYEIPVEIIRSEFLRT